MVQIGEISFCDKVAFNIKSDDTKKMILDRINSLYQLKIISRHFEKYNPSLTNMLNTNPHMLCVRSNGNPYFLYLTKINFVNYCIFIDKKIQQGYFYPRMIITTFHFEDELFKDTIFDGEMVKNNDGKWLYIINDLIVVKGEHLNTFNLIKRLNILYNLLSVNFYPDSMDVIKIQVKKYFSYDEKEDFLNTFIPKLNYT